MDTFLINGADVDQRCAVVVVAVAVNICCKHLLGQLKAFIVNICGRSCKHSFHQLALCLTLAEYDATHHESENQGKAVKCLR